MKVALAVIATSTFSIAIALWYASYLKSRTNELLERIAEALEGIHDKELLSERGRP